MQQRVPLGRNMCIQLDSWGIGGGWRGNGAAGISGAERYATIRGPVEQEGAAADIRPNPGSICDVYYKGLGPLNLLMGSFASVLGK
ncbi:hypothetical protein GCM10017711_19120 [Paeniglutamicibacter sulfureus]